MNLSNSVAGGLDSVIRLLGAIKDPRGLEKSLIELREQEKLVKAELAKIGDLLREEKIRIEKEKEELSVAQKDFAVRSSDLASRIEQGARAEATLNRLREEFRQYESETRAKLQQQLESLQAERLAFEADSARRLAEIQAKEEELQEGLSRLALQEAETKIAAENAENKRVEFESKLAKLKEITG